MLVYQTVNSSRASQDRLSEKETEVEGWGPQILTGCWNFISLHNSSMVITGTLKGPRQALPVSFSLLRLKPLLTFLIFGVGGGYMHAWVQYQGRPEEGVRSPGAGVVSTGSWTQAFYRSSKYWAVSPVSQSFNKTLTLIRSTSPSRNNFQCWSWESQFVLSKGS